MFLEATSFDQNLGNWNIENVTKLNNFLEDPSCHLKNYDLTLKGWSEQNLKTDINFHGGTSQYCEASDARQLIIDTYGWTFTDGGKLPFCGEDNDADGVLDQNDVCLNTRPNVTVDEKGCEIISNNAITVYDVAPSCPGVSNAGIRISSSLIDYSFDISIIGTYSEDYLGVSLNDPFEIKDLSPGLYTLNISIPVIYYFPNLWSQY